MKLKKGIVLLFIQFFALLISAKTYVLENGFESQFVGKDLLMLEDKNCGLTIGDLQGNKLIWNDLNEMPYFWKSENCFWYQLSIFNASKVQKNLILEITNFQIDSLDFYVLNNKIIEKEYFTGNGRGYISREVYDRNFLFKINIPAGQSRKLFFKTYPQANLMSFPLTMWDANKKFENSQRKEMSKGVLFGVVILFFLITFYLSLILRIRNYFLYGLHVLSGTLYYFVQQGIAFEFFWMNSPKLQDLFSYILLNIFLLTAIVFMKQFFIKRTIKSNVFYLFDGFILICFLFIVLNIFQILMPIDLLRMFFLVQNIGILSILILLVCILTYGYFLIKEKSLYFISMAFFLFLSLIIFNPLLSNFFPPNNKFYLLTLYFGGWVLALVMSILLVTRSRSIIIANKKVREEMAVLNKRYGFYLLEGEEKERKRVAEELHDGIGISLSTLKIKMSILLAETEDLTLIRFLGNNIKEIDLQCELVRDLSHQLREKSLERYGLKLSIEDYIKKLNKVKKRDFAFMQNIKVGELTPTSEMAILKIIKGLLEPIWAMEFVKMDLKVIVFYSTEKAILKLTIEGEGFTLNLPSFNDIKNIITLLHGEINEISPNAISKIINIEIPVLMNSKKEI